MKESMEYIEVTLDLKPSQQMDMNKWAVSINHEQRIVTNRRVMYCLLDFEEATRSFNATEVDGVSIKRVINDA